MNATHIHLLLTHFPIVGTFIGIGILAYGLYSNNDLIKKTALAIFIVMAVSTIPVFLTGEEAEETVEHISGISEHLIEQHEELAEKAIWLMGLLGLFSIVSFYAITKNKAFAKITTLVTFFLSLGTFGLFAQVGNFGGQIRHSEIRSEGTSLPDQNQEENKKEERDDD